MTTSQTHTSLFWLIKVYLAATLQYKTVLQFLIHFFSPHSLTFLICSTNLKKILCLSAHSRATCILCVNKMRKWRGSFVKYGHFLHNKVLHVIFTLEKQTSLWPHWFNIMSVLFLLCAFRENYFFFFISHPKSLFVSHLWKQNIFIYSLAKAHMKMKTQIHYFYPVFVHSGN